MANADRYSGLVTALAVLITVFYAEGKYDGWDIYLGVVGVILGLKYRKAVSRSDLFFSFLTASLLAIGTTACIFGVIQLCVSAQEAITLNYSQGQ